MDRKGPEIDRRQPAPAIDHVDRRARDCGRVDILLRFGDNRAGPALGPRGIYLLGCRQIARNRKDQGKEGQRLRKIFMFAHL